MRVLQHLPASRARRSAGSFPGSRRWSRPWSGAWRRRTAAARRRCAARWAAGSASAMVAILRASLRPPHQQTSNITYLAARDSSSCSNCIAAGHALADRERQRGRLGQLRGTARSCRAAACLRATSACTAPSAWAMRMAEVRFQLQWNSIRISISLAERVAQLAHGREGLLDIRAVDVLVPVARRRAVERPDLDRLHSVAVDQLAHDLLGLGEEVVLVREAGVVDAHARGLTGRRSGDRRAR